MEASDILYLNPNYFIRHDETRSLLWARSKEKSQDTYSRSFHSFIHPYHAEFLALFNGENSVSDVIKKSRLGQIYGIHTLSFIRKILANEKPYYVESNGSRFLFPSNLLLYKGQDAIMINPHSRPMDFSFQELDFKTQKLNFPLYITYMVNTICRTNCIYCYADCRERKKRQIPIEKVMALLDEIEQHPILDFTIMGGEFFLDENWELILSRLKELDLLPVISTKIPISEAIIKKLSLLGVSKIQISLDSTNPSVLSRLLNVNGEKYITDMQKTFILLKQYGISTKINAVITRYNDTVDELGKLLDFLANYNIDSVTVIRAGFSLYKPLDYIPSDESIEQITKYVEKVKDNYDFPIKMSLGFPKKYFDATSLQKKQYFCNRSLCTGNLWQAFIMPNGDVTFCEGTMSHPAFVLGNICKESFGEVWKKSMPHLSDKRNYADSVCGSCKDFDVCHNDKGVCWKYIIQGYGWKNVYSPDPRCPQAPALINRLD